MITAEVIRLSRAAARDIPEATLAMARLCLLDWLGLVLAAQAEPVVQLLMRGARAEGAAPAATILGHGRRFSARQAALVNGVAGHALDYDDVNLAMNVHPTAVLMPGILALAEARGLSGRALLEAFVAGYEAAGLIGRMMARGHYARGFHATGTIGTFGAAAACAHIIGLDEEATARAYGLAASQAAGLKAQFGTMAKPLHAGRAAEAGLLAALWAEAGMTARTDSLEARQGFFATQADGVEPPLWIDHELDRNLFKFHASCFGTHGTLEAVGALRRLGVTPEKVHDIHVTVHPGLDRMCNIASPSSGLEAKFSLRFSAVLALHGENTADPATYGDGIAARDDLRRTAGRVTVTLAPPDWPEDLTEVVLHCLDGRRFEMRHDSSEPPADIGPRLHAKFRALASPSLHDRTIPLAQAVEGIGQAGDAGHLLSFLSPG
ncbi:MmgE/PrpD family protein [soil metagenome]